MSTRMDRIRDTIENIKGIVEDLKSDINQYNYEVNDDDWLPDSYEIFTIQFRYKKEK